MATKPKAGGKAGIITVRLKKKTALAPCTLGYNNLVTPDDKFGEPKYRALFHLSDKQMAHNIGILDAAGPELLDKWAEESGRAGTIDAETWLSGKLKDATENMQCQDQFMDIGLKALEGVSKRTGRPYKIEPRAWDRKNQLLDLATLKLGAGSLVQPIVTIGIYTSSLAKEPQFTLRLEGVRILKLVQWQGGGLAGISDEDLNLIDDEELDDDLSAFLQGAEGGAEDEGNDEAPSFL